MMGPSIMIFMDVPDLLRWGAAAVSLLGLGLTMGFSPTLYGMELHLLVHDRQAVSGIHWMVGGLFAGSTILFLLFQAVDPENLERLLRYRADSLLLRRWVDVVAGSLLIIAAAVLARRIKTDRLRPSPHRTHRTPAKPWHGFLIGMSNTVLGVSGVATMYVTGRVVAAAAAALPVRALFYAIFVVTLVGPYLLVAHLWRDFPRLAARVSHGYERIAHRDIRKPVAAALALVGLAFIGFGILHGTG